MSQNVVFIYPRFVGHINRGLYWARYFMSQGMSTHFLLHGNPNRRVDFGSATYEMISDFIVGKNVKDFVRNKIELEKLVHDLTTLRQNLLNKIKTLKPKLIIVEEFCSADLLLILNDIDVSTVRVVTCSYPHQRNKHIPPQQYFAFPGMESEELWNRVDAEHKKNLTFRKIKLFYHHLFKHLQISWKYKIHSYFEYFPQFSTVEKWYMCSESFDFPGQVLFSWEKYVGPSILLDRTETKDPIAELFVRKAISNEGNKLIYVSLGTVISDFISDKVLLDFFSTLNKIGFECKELHFFISVPPKLLPLLRPYSMNVFFGLSSNQLFLLKHSDLLLTHGGTSSVNEALSLNVPMLTFPEVSFLDTRGTCARVVYHGFGSYSSLTDSKEEIKEKIISLL